MDLSSWLFHTESDEIRTGYESVLGDRGEGVELRRLRWGAHVFLQGRTKQVPLTAAFLGRKTRKFKAEKADAETRQVRPQTGDPKSVSAQLSLDV